MVKLEEIDSFDREEYIEKCKCGKSYEVRTQKYDCSEYMTMVYIKCECGNYIEFELPVN